MKIVKSTKIIAGEVTQAEVEALFEDLLKFQGYGFCMAHSVSYGVLSAWTLYLKAHYLSEFMCCLLRRTPRNKEDRRGLSVFESRVKYAQRQGIEFFGPSVNKSKADFDISDGGIRYGLSGIKGISSAADEIVSHQPYKSFQDFVGKVNARVIHKGRIENLIFAGAFDEFGDKETLWNQHRKICEDKGKSKKNDSTPDIFGALFASGVSSSALDAMLEEEDKEHRCFTENELLDQEKDMLGVILSSNLLIKHAEVIKKEGLRTIGEILEKKLKSPRFLGKVMGVSTFTSKKQSITYYKLILDDGLQNVTLMMGQGLYNSNSARLKLGNDVIVSANFEGNGKADCWLNDREEIKVIERKTP